MYTIKTLTASKRVFLIYSLGVFFVSIIVWNLVRFAVNFTMTIKNSAIWSVKKLERTFCKIGLVTLFSISLLLIFGLVAPKAECYEENRWLEVTDGVSPQQIADWCKTNYPSLQYINDDNYIIFVYYIWGNRWIFDCCFYPSEVTSVNFTDTQDDYYTADTVGSYVTASFDDGSFPNNYAGGQVQGYYLKLRVQSLDPAVLYSNKIVCTYPPNVVVRPPVTVTDDFFIHAQSYNIQYEVSAISSSNDMGWWHQTRRYKLTIAVTYNNQPLVITVPSYISWFMDLAGPVVGPHDGGQIDNGWYPSPYSAVTDYMQSLSSVTKPTVVQSLSSPDIDYNSDTFKDPRINSMPFISLSNLLSYIKDITSDNTLTDDFMYQDMTVSFVGYDDNKTYFSQILRYSNVASDTPLPPPDPSEPDWLHPLNDVINQINNNRTYNYLTQLPDGWIAPSRLASLDSITSIDSPDYSFPDIGTIDSSATGFFSWLVDLIVSSPIGIIILVGLAFLVVKAVVHQ